MSKIEGRPIDYIILLIWLYIKIQTIEYPRIGLNAYNTVIPLVDRRRNPNMI